MPIARAALRLPPPHPHSLSKKCLLPVSLYVPLTSPPPLTHLPRFLVNLVWFSDFYLIYFTYQKRAKLLKRCPKASFIALYLLLLRNTYCPCHFTYHTPPLFNEYLLSVPLYVLPTLPHSPSPTHPLFKKCLLSLHLYVTPPVAPPTRPRPYLFKKCLLPVPLSYPTPLPF
jgi:hypothetical protein